MARHKLPTYRLHRSSGQAVIEYRGQRYYLGKYGSEESRERYKRFLAEITTRPVPVEPGNGLPGDGPALVEILAAYWQFSEGYYDARTCANIRPAVRAARELYGRAPATSFGPLALQALQRHFVRQGLSRPYVNRLIDIVKRMIKWAVSQELLPPSTYHALATVPGLKRGRTTAREPEPIRPVAEAVVEATLRHAPAVVADMIRVQRLTGARPAEICILRPGDIERHSDVWIYCPTSHKTQHHGRERFILIGPQAQSILTSYILRPADSSCFSPAESMRKQLDQRHTRRKTPLSCGNRPGTNHRRRPQRRPKERYSVCTYRHATTAERPGEASPMSAPAPLLIDAPDLSGPIPEHVAEAIARMLLEAADAELAAEQQASSGGGRSA